MNILINNEKIDFTLDGEKNCLDVVNGLSDWLESQEFFISEISLDGKEYFLQNKEILKEQNIENITSLEVTALDRTQVMLKDLGTVKSYFELYFRALEENNRSVMEDLGNQYQSIRNNLPQLLMMNGYVFDTTLNQLMDESGVLSGAPGEESREKLKQEWANVDTLIMGRMGELSQPVTEGLKTAATLNRLVPRIEEVSVLFQSGKDREALDIIIVLTELLAKSVRILTGLSEKGKELALPEDFISGLNGILSELAEAIDSGDTILTGDLAEYEIVPKIEILEEVFQSLSREEC
ncbi:MAG: hypothetical protein PQJ60_09840 [Spirochaetales bacterium]|nr:hypothetical protein [Spirochaetales bacterium]